MPFRHQPSVCHLCSPPLFLAFLFKSIAEALLKTLIFRYSLHMLAARIGAFVINRVLLM